MKKIEQIMTPDGSLLSRTKPFVNIESGKENKDENENNEVRQGENSRTEAICTFTNTTSQVVIHT